MFERMAGNKPISNPGLRRYELAQSLLDISADQDEALRSAAHVAPTTEALSDVLRLMNELHPEMGRFPTNEIDLLKRLIHMGTDHAVLWRLLVKSKLSDPERMRHVLSEVAEEFGGLRALYSLIDPGSRHLDEVIDAILPVTNAEDERRRHVFLNGSRTLNTSQLSVRKTPEIAANQVLETYRYSVAAILMGTHPNSLTRDREREDELYERDIEDALSEQACHVIIEPPSNGSILVRLLLPFTAEVMRFSAERIDEFAKFLKLDGEQSLTEIVRTNSSYNGSAVVKMLHPKGTRYARMPMVLRKSIIR